MRHLIATALLALATVAPAPAATHVGKPATTPQQTALYRQLVSEIQSLTAQEQAVSLALRRARSRPEIIRLQTTAAEILRKKTQKQRILAGFPRL